MFLIIWFKRKSIIMETLKRFMWKALICTCGHAMNRRIAHFQRSLSEFIKMTAYDSRAKIPETVIDNFVDRVVFDHGDFIWYLNPTFENTEM